ncbi:hypothetical protein E2320_017634 [Naja naja]|nr:hypothetical protein E2320_017634 [Naja naja]
MQLVVSSGDAERGSLPNILSVGTHGLIRCAQIPLMVMLAKELEKMNSKASVGYLELLKIYCEEPTFQRKILKWDGRDRHNSMQIFLLPKLYNPLRMSHVLHFEDKTRKVKDASMQDEDTFEIYDPRNPVNKRRREESKKILREKKARR